MHPRAVHVAVAQEDGSIDILALALPRKLPRSEEDTSIIAEITAEPVPSAESVCITSVLSKPRSTGDA